MIHVCIACLSQRMLQSKQKGCSSLNHQRMLQPKPLTDVATERFYLFFHQGVNPLFDPTNKRVLLPFLMFLAQNNPDSLHTSSSQLSLAGTTNSRTGLFNIPCLTRRLFLFSFFDSPVLKPRLNLFFG